MAAAAAGGREVVNDPNYATCPAGLPVQRIGGGVWIHEDDDSHCTHEREAR